MSDVTAFTPKQVPVAPGVVFSNALPFGLIAGPCQIETQDHALMIAERLATITSTLQIPFVYKSSFDKANRTSLGGKRGPGLEAGLATLAAVKQQIGCPVLTDIHLPEQCEPVAGVVDVLQIPAFLCRQTDLLIAAAQTGKPINIKKGQFLAPWDMTNVMAKITGVGNDNVMLCERGTSFGYNTLVTDFRGLPTMALSGQPVIFDATHSVQQPGGQGRSSGGDRRFVPVLARAALSVGVAGVFMETHQDPDTAPSDGPNMVPLDQIEQLLATLKAFDTLAKANPIAL
jgi:2-dehydro-3-deoxyphosphooctonate aldolase (KDO 8-P synthase)